MSQELSSSQQSLTDSDTTSLNIFAGPGSGKSQDYQSLELLQEIQLAFPSIEFGDDSNEKGDILTVIRNAQYQGQTSVEYRRNNPNKAHYSIIYEEYEKSLYRRNLLAYELFRSHGELLANIKAIIVDEVQDLNKIMHLILSEISKNKIITTAGDKHQRAYRWISPNFDVTSMMQVTNEPSLLINYRSSRILGEAAEYFKTQNVANIETSNPQGVPISLISVYNEFEQAEFVACEIKRMVRASKGLIKYGDCAVLIRMHSISHHFESTFRRHQIPFNIRGDSFFRREEIVDIISYLKFSINPMNIAALYITINAPSRDIELHTLKQLEELNKKQQYDLLKTMEYLTTGNGSFSESTRLQLTTFLSICINEALRAIIKYIIEKTEYKDYLNAKFCSKEYATRWSYVNQLLSLVTPSAKRDNDNPNQQDINPPVDVEAFLTYFDENRNTVQDNAASSKKNLGDEWPAVFVASCNDNCIPLIRSDLREERTVAGSVLEQHMSSFVHDIPKRFCANSSVLWNDETIQMLAETLKKPMPSNNDELVSTQTQPQRKRPHSALISQ
ncbi:hypothetical protein MBANPS3_001678 [Mucor bainieri]